jgi:hypothetical protein
VSPFLFKSKAEVLNIDHVQDCGDMDDCARCVKDTITALGGLDVIIGNAVRWIRTVLFSSFIHRLY